MKILQNYVAPIYTKRVTQQSFGQQSPIENNTQQEQTPVQMQNVTQPALNVKVPIAYNHTEDIKLNDELTAHCYKLANGQKVIIVPKDGPTIVKSYVNTGSFNEPDNLRGISHFIEHNLFNGSETLGDKVFFDEVNKMGASTNASTSFDKTDYYIDSNLLDENDFENQLYLHAGMLQSPKFLLEKLEKEKKIVNSEINMCVSENENLGFTQTVKNLFNIKSSSSDLVAGTTNNISNLTRDDVVKYYNDNYYPANTVTVITGEVEPQKAMDLVSKYFNSNKMPTNNRHFEKMTPTEKPVRSDIISPKSTSNEATVFIGFAGPENNNTKDKVHLNALYQLIGGLYDSKLAPLERKYGTGINISPERLSSRPDDNGLILVSTGVADDKSEAMLKDIYGTLYKITQNPPTDEELTAIKNRMKKSHDKTFEISGGVNYMVGSAFLNNNIDSLKDFNKIIDEMTAQDIVNVAKKYLDLNKAAVTVVHPSQTRAETIDKNHKAAQNIAFTGANKKTPIDTSKVNTYKLENNMEVVCNDVKSDNVEFGLSITAKDWTPKKAAIADILDNIYRKEDSTNMTVDEINKFSDIHGISSSVNICDYGIGFHADFPANQTKEAFEFFNNRIKNPKIDDTTVKNAISRLKDEYQSYEVSPMDKFAKIMYKGTPNEFTPQDKLASLDTITTQDIKDYFNEIFEKSEANAVISGNFEKYPEIKQEVFNTMSTYNTFKPKDVSLLERYTPVEKTEVCTDVHKKNQANIIEGFKFKRSKNIKDIDTVELLNEILGGSPSSRLFSDLREKRHLAYAVGSSYSYLDDMGVFRLNIGTTTENQETGEKTFDNVQKSIDGFNENIKKIMNEKVTDEELANAKKAIKTKILSILETNSDKNAALLGSNKSYYGADYMNKRLADIDTITAEDIQIAAKNIFNSKPIYSITATDETLKQNQDYLNNLAK